MKYQHFSIEERESLQYMWWERKSIRSIAKALNRSPSSVSRELKRNFPPEREVYTSRLAQERALNKRRSRGRHDRLKNAAVRQYVITRLKEGWSPEQIAGRIKLDLNQRISHEAIYQYIYAQVYRNGYGALKPGQEDLRIYLRRKRKRRAAKGFRKSQKISARFGIPTISDRPIVVDTRKRLGDWEGDTVVSKDHRPGLNTLVERKTGYLLMTKLTANHSQATINAMESRLAVLPMEAKHTVTLDNGPENRDWQGIEAETGLKCFYANPYHSWERGTNENANGLVREYFPKKTDFSTIPEELIAAIEYKLNTRPRKRLNYLTPLEAFSVALEG